MTALLLALPYVALLLLAFAEGCAYRRATLDDLRTLARQLERLERP